MDNKGQSYISYFNEGEIKVIALPEKFTFPFYYEPHPLTIVAVADLQQYLETQTDLDHNFGLDDEQDGPVIGKMFGVLVVQDAGGKLGYLSAFSGKMAGSNNHSKFVPPVFDMLIEDSFFLKGQDIINSINQQVKAIERDENYNSLKQELGQDTTLSQTEISEFKKLLKSNKNARKALREAQKNVLSEQNHEVFETDLIKQSLRDKHEFNVLSNKWEQHLAELTSRIAQFEDEVEELKKDRRERSSALQQQLFEQYVFLNKGMQEKSLQEIFSATVFGKPPAAAGECATPKLLQYAFKHGHKPIAMAEFWWGTAPKSEIRKHKQFYPACTGKCKPILAHMLEGMPVDDNPLLENFRESYEIDIIYEDDFFVVVNKPAELRSVPGVNVHDSVYSRLKVKFGGIEPLIVHRLDMGTSGLIVVAKIKEAHKFIQAQFLKRTVTKRYTALLSKVIRDSEGEINLPLRADLLNRPRQLVCFEEGKKAVTKWEVIQRNKDTTKVHFWPQTGRTHQLRMHSAHLQGLNAPIVGDDLYGTSDDRMYLHAAYLQFVHPQTKQTITFEIPEDF
ncbi:pseudouridine synthase [Mucilaginibacter sp. RB4R14]|uniref:RluA family pseudouridine synthase n=1 Tax=Mucilaginibacter aurantiaciroseus TaxID=2949308 RepID=UPI0020919629|nr:RluA family pseudouridine synthase [Mucilaginibacter aurantiaciroseus]MCO5936424.1 pseudouridine synthase [Mucilaginibacter aurantiaciroseus]